ncbi:MAG: small GTP-binding protein [Methylocystaceae bacterium]|nr:MAG: small GTP-binding protein [Methylocystaceae bacterium]
MTGKYDIFAGRRKIDWGLSMTHFHPKAAEELLKKLGPSDEHAKKLNETFLGSLLGQSRAFLVQIAIYVAIFLGTFKYLGYTPKELNDALGPVWFAAMFGVPLLVIFVCSFTPAFFRARRERRLKQRAIAGGACFEPGYFRLTPYEESDRDKFQRLDGVDDAIFNWLTHTEQSLLYLSGASGVGKSSLLAADVEPRLRELGWIVLQTRLFGDPVERISAALREGKGLFAQQPRIDTGLCELLEQAAQSRKTPLLLVIDQFEEFLMLNKPEQHEHFAAFLHKLAGNPVEGLRLLLVYRSDYRALIFKLALPSPILGKNWIEIAPYNRGEATQFLQSGGRQLSEEGLAALFRGLDRIEEARGIYRLITLNMVGLILECMGQNLDENPERLIQRYLMNCLTSSDGSEYARRLLEQMISEAGTKEPRTEVALIHASGMEAWQVKSALTGLEAQGLVRRLEEADPTWEVSHDFIARALGRLIGRLKPSIFQRTEPYITPIMLVLWIALLGLFIPEYLTRVTEQRVMKYMTLRNVSGVLTLRPVETNFNDPNLLVVVADLMRLPGKVSLNLSGTAVSNIDALKGLKSLTWLNLSNTAVSNVDALKELKSLTTLYLAGTAVSNIDSLKVLKSLMELDLSGTRVSNVNVVKELWGLRWLSLSGLPVSNVDALKELWLLMHVNLSGTAVSNIDALNGLKSLTTLDLSRTAVSNVDALKELTSLTQLALSGTAVSDIDALKELTSLTQLDLSNTPVSDIDALKELKSLTWLDLSNTAVSNVDALKGLTSLTQLGLGGTQVSNIDALKMLKSLTWLDLSGTAVSNVDPLKELWGLTQLSLSGTAVTDVDALKDLMAKGLVVQRLPPSTTLMRDKKLKKR